MRKLILKVALLSLCLSSVSLAAGLDRRGTLVQNQTLTSRFTSYDQTLRNAPFNGPYFQQFIQANAIAANDLNLTIQGYTNQDSDSDIKARFQSLIGSGSYLTWLQLFAQGEGTFNNEANNNSNTPVVRAKWRALLLEGQAIRFALQNLQNTYNAWMCVQ